LPTAIATLSRNLEPYDLSSLTIDRHLASPEELENGQEYLRHKITPSGISPRLIPGKSEWLVVTDSDEHTEDGHLTEDLKVRVKMVDKRNRKYQGLASEVEPPVLTGPAETDLLLIGWGSTCGVIREAVQGLKAQGKSVSQLHFPQLWPFPAQRVSEIFKQAKRKIIIENNSTGQLSWLLRAETGLTVDDMILKYDGRPFSTGYILEALKK